MIPAFSEFPDEARVWVYASDQSMEEDHQQKLVAAMSSFTDSWTYHGKPVRGTVACYLNRFLLLVAETDSGSISGCGIDASVHALEEHAKALGIQWSPPLNVLFSDESGVRSASRSDLAGLVESNRLNANTSVFDLSVTTLKQLRDGDFQRRAAETWIGDHFDLSEPQLAE